MSLAQWAQWSNSLVNSAIAVLALALLALAAEMAFGSRSRVGRRLAEVEAVKPELVAVGSPSDSTQRHPASIGSTEGVIASQAAPEGDRAAAFGRIGMVLFGLATALLGAGVVCRGLAAERAPWGNMYEFAITGGFVSAVAYLGIQWRYRAARAMAVWVVLLILLFLGLAVIVLYVPAGPLVPALRSPWLVIHVFAAILSTGLFTVSVVASVMHLAADRRVSSGRPLGRLPQPAALDRLAYQVIAFAFPIWTFAVVAGAIWADVSWGRFWNWDPKETWAFITWVAYAAYLHARTTAGWKGRKASYVSLAAYATIIFNWTIVNFFISGLHAYA